MSERDARPTGGGSGRPGINVRQLWTGGAATALVALLIALVGLVIARGVLHIPVLGPSRYGTLGDVSTVWMCLFAAVAALLATGLMHLLLLSTPRPTTFFGWIVALATTAVAVRPFTTTAALETQLATCVLNVLLGIAIGTLVGGVAASAARRP
ncbi:MULTISPECIES: DUF6069 family protein [Actinopolyspora]|uniref:Uncharacterized protein n=1 Tax=Actinopolyspora saharensis TaxID=995062 RepID=A0A1H1AKQ9_9ACTN|nr:DUF6069 family protein [Actinopolyspora saharensis]NHD17039.1 hypothetical protein [Actinopolyspora sp. BKK2]NHE76191.1 hypothetical protein [Actinopolyspora sp. BKK1]SDQ40353.1 hypothetical protein SAMN04489718_1629 [Actinopolyspora saharensis]